MKLIRHVREFMNETRKNTSPENEFHPSGISGDCPRKIYYDKKTKEYAFSARTLQAFETGNAIHYFCHKYLRFLEKISYIEIIKIETPRIAVFVDEDFSINGTLDARIIERDTGDEIIIDFKSIKSFKCYKSKTDTTLIDVPLPKPEHVCQLNMYMFINSVKKGKLIYIDKQSFAQKFDNKDVKMKEFSIEYDEKLVREKLKQLNTINKCIKNNTLPQRIDGYPGCWQCGYCDHKSNCDIDVVITQK